MILSQIYGTKFLVLVVPGLCDCESLIQNDSYAHRTIFSQAAAVHGMTTSVQRTAQNTITSLDANVKSNRNMQTYRSICKLMQTMSCSDMLRHVVMSCCCCQEAKVSWVPSGENWQSQHEFFQSQRKQEQRIHIKKENDPFPAATASLANKILLYQSYMDRDSLAHTKRTHLYTQDTSIF